MGNSICAYRVGYIAQLLETLELGIDVGTLHLGFPGSVASLWQQSGKVKALAVYVAFEGLLDQYFMNFPPKLLRSPVECYLIDSKNQQKLPSRVVSIRAIEAERYKGIDKQKNEVLKEIEESKVFFQVFLERRLLYQAKAENKYNLVNNTIGVIFYSCPHFGSKLADMPWRMGLVFRPAPTIGELRSGSPRLVKLNDFLRHLHKKGTLDVLSFCETKVTPIVEGYGGWAFGMEIVPIESAYPGFVELVVLESTDHVNSCKPLSRSDPSYKETVDFLHKLKSHYT